MKSKYVVLRESGYDVTNGHSSYSKVKSFRNEPEAMAFITDPKNLRLYGELFLELDQGLSFFRINRLEHKILFLDATDEVLIKRYKETRRRHPLDEVCHGSIQQAIAMERQMLMSVREKADYYLDTSDFSAAQLKENVYSLFLDNPNDSMVVKIMSFGFKYGCAREADLVFDVRCLPNPYYISELREHNGTESCVSDYVMKFEQSQELLNKLEELIDFLVPLYIHEGKSQLVIAFGCTGGKHRSVTFAERMYNHLISKDIKCRICHKDINKK